MLLAGGALLLAAACGRGTEHVALLAPTTKAGSAPSPANGTATTAVDDFAGAARRPPDDVCAFVKRATVARVMQSDVAGKPIGIATCRWSSEVGSVVLNVEPASDFVALSGRYQREHPVVELAPTVGKTALVSHDGRAWGLAVSQSGLWFQVSGAATRDDALALGVDLAAAAHHPS